MEIVFNGFASRKSVQTQRVVVFSSLLTMYSYGEIRFQSL